MSATPASTANPFDSSSVISSADERRSSRPVSAQVQIFLFTSASARAFASTQPSAWVLAGPVVWAPAPAAPAMNAPSSHVVTCRISLSP